MRKAKQLLNKAIVLKLQIDELTSQYNDIKAELKEIMIDKQLEDVSTTKAKAHHMNYERETFDKALFKKRCPKIYRRFIYTITVDSVAITEKSKANKET